MTYPTAKLSIGRNVWLAIALFLASIAAVAAGPAQAREQTLKLYFAHTGERGEFTYKRNGRYDRAELARINKFLRDWRRNEPAQMDPKLLDLVWAIYKESGSRDYIHVVSAYRSPATNNMLRSRSKGVAEKSQHTLGKAMDWYVKDVPLAKLRAIAMKLQGGGVGYYPKSGSPFVHTDTGNVRAWPRMSRSQLIALFPNGETLHLPADGKPLPGYERALAARKSAGGTQLAYLETGDERGSDGKGWLKRLFDGGADQAEDDGASATAAAPAPKPARGEPAQLAPDGPAEPSAPPAPATGDPQVLIATAEAAGEPRLPKARPAAEAGQMLASAPVLAAADSVTVASLAFAPPPRSRPDAALLAGSLGTGNPDALAVAAEDALAALALQAEGGTPAQQESAVAPVQVAYADDAGEATLSDADRAILAGFSAIEDIEVVPADAAAVTSSDSAIAAVNALGEPAGAPTPRPRPIAVAFTGDGLAPAEPAEPVLVAAQPAAAPATASASAGEAIDAAPAAEPAYGADQGALVDLIAMPAAEDASAGFAMPQPAGAPGLFAIPASAAALADSAPVPPVQAEGFQAGSDDAAGEESFFSRLFASLAD